MPAAPLLVKEGLGEVKSPENHPPLVLVRKQTLFRLPIATGSWQGQVRVPMRSAADKSGIFTSSPSTLCPTAQFLLY